MPAMDYPRLTWLPMLKQGCCCSLETCCKLQGFLSLIHGFLQFIYAIWMLANSKHEDLCLVLTNDKDGKLCWALGVSIALLTYSVINIIVSVVFLMGISQSRASLLTPYLVLSYIELVLCIHLSITVGVFIPVVSLFITLPVLGLSVYCLLCVNSLRAQFKFKENGVQPLHSQDFDNPMA